MRELLVFDMDGVLVDVKASYRETIRQTVYHFTGKAISYDLIQQYKNQGGWNNDWALSQKIAADLGVNVPYEEVVAHFQKLFLGDSANGLIRLEQWIARPGVLEALQQSRDLAIYTGRPRFEAGLTLSRFAAHLRFDPVISADDVACGKPHPEGLLKIAAAAGGRPLWYIGDTVDDARCARAAHVPFIGVAAAGAGRRDELLELFAAEGAAGVITSINELEQFLAHRQAIA